MAKRFINVKRRLSDVATDFYKSLSSEETKDSFLKPPKKDERGWLARKIDYISVRVLSFLAIAFLVSFKFSLYTAVIAAAAGTFFLHLILHRSEKTRESRNAEKMREYIVRNHTYEQIMKMDPAAEFKIMMAQVLNGLDGFSGIKQGTTNGSSSKFDLVGKFKDYPIAVTCNRYKKENEVEKVDLVKFTAEMKKAGVTRGIFLTTSSFSEWAIDYVHSIKDELRIVLVDKNKLLEWIRLSGHSIYPNSQKAEELEIKKIEQDRMVSLQKKEKQNKRLMQAFFLVSIYLTVLSFLMQRWLQDWMLYLYFGFAVLNMLLGLLWYCLFRHTRAVVRQSYMLEQLD